MPSKSVTYKDASRVNWSRNIGVDPGHVGTPYPGMDAVQLGCLQRMADASEAMAVNYVRLQQDLENYKRWYNDSSKRIQRLEADLITKRRLVTRYKNQISKLKGPKE